jgi:hypothetical protein
MFRRLALLILILCAVKVAWSQNYGLSENISFNASDLTFSEVMKGFEMRTGTRIQYDAQLVSENRRFQIAYNNVRARQAMKDFLNAQGLDFNENGNELILHKRSAVQAQMYHVITGRVVSAGAGEHIAGAQIMYGNPARTVYTSDAGFFKLLVNPGVLVLRISYAGYEGKTDSLSVDRNYIVHYELRSSGDSIAEVKVNGIRGKGLQTVHQGQTDHNEINRIKMRWSPQLLGEPDILRTIGLMPGVVGGSEGMLGMFVRGGTADQNLVLLDDVPIFNCYHLYGIFSVFNDDVVKSAKLIKGSFPAKYGGRLSSVVSVDSKEGNKEGIKGSVGLGLLACKAFLEGPIWKDRTTFLFSFRRSYLDFLAKPAINFIVPGDSINSNNTYYFWDANFRITHRFNSRSRISAGLYSGMDVGGLDEETRFQTSETETFEKRRQITGWGNRLLGIRWNYLSPSGTEFTAKAHISSYNYNYTQDYRLEKSSSLVPSNNISDLVRYRFGNGIEDYEIGGVAAKRLRPWLKLEGGAGLVMHRFIPGRRSLFSNINGVEKEEFFSDINIWANEAYSFAELQGHYKSKWFWTLGCRTSLFWIGDSTRFLYAEPRINIRRKLGAESFLHLSATRNRQFFHLLNNLRLGLPSDIWVPSSQQFQPGICDQLSVGWSKTTGQFAVSTDVFFKSMSNLLEYKDGAAYQTSGSSWEDNVTSGRGEAYGLEWMAEKNKGRFKGWMSYTLLWSNRFFAELNQGRVFPDRFDRRHNVYLAGTWLIKNGIELNASWCFNSGFWYTLPLGRYTSPVPGDPYREVYVYGERNNNRTADNHRLDVSVSLEKKYRWYTRTIIVGVFNAYNRFNPFFINLGYNSRGERKLYQVSMMPALPNVSYKISF